MPVFFSSPLIVWPLVVSLGWITFSHEGQASCLQDLKLMTFNIRHATFGLVSYFTKNGWNYVWNPRSSRVKAVVERWNPDILGTQEGMDSQIKELRQAWNHYEFWGVGRDDGETDGEYAAIFYRKDRFIRTSGGHFWLSPTPDVPGTAFPGAANNRMVSWVRLSDQASQKTYLVANTHWDHKSSESRKLSAELMTKRLGQMVQSDEHMIVLGDLNNIRSSPEVTSLREGLGLKDAYTQVHGPSDGNDGTHHRYRGSPQSRRIDFVLLSPGLQVMQADIIRESFSDLYPSDHFPVQVTVCADLSRS